MATLKQIKGTAIQFLDSDPVVYAGSWSSGGSLNTARGYLDGVGIQTAALGVSGYTTTNVAVVEQYNGTSWTEVGDVNTARESWQNTRRSFSFNRILERIFVDRSKRFK